MSTKKLTAHRVVGVFAATIVSITLGGLATTTTVHAAVPMAKCVPGTGNPLNPCP